MIRIRSLILILSLVCSGALTADIDYEVRFTGISETETSDLLQNISQLIALQECPPATEMALQRRVEAEIPRLFEALYSRAYFDADINFTIDFAQSPAIVTYQVTPGSVYALTSFQILPSTQLEEADVPTDWFLAYDTIDLSDLGICLGDPARADQILEAEELLLAYLESLGYPLAKIVTRDVIADLVEKEVSATFYVASGPVAYFGPINLTGLKSVYPAFVYRRIAWCEGDLYDPSVLQCTFNALDRTGLFSGIQIYPDDTPDGENEIPIVVDLTEGKMRSIGFGASYTTQWGGGILAEWEHRNAGGMGERLTLKTELMQREQMGSISFGRPDFMSRGQDLLVKAEAEHEITEGFHETSGSLTARLSRKLNACLTGSAGVGLKYLNSSDSDNNRAFFLAKVPLQLLFHNAGSQFDPFDGVSVKLRVTPTAQLRHPQANYCITTLDAAFYKSLFGCEWTVFAAKVSLGFIPGASRHAIPPPERFYAGSQYLLRGYRYLTVSPLDAQNKPIGGRSLAVFSFELRQRFTEDWGGVIFYDVGNVYASIFPQLDRKQLQSTGIGVRYFTSVGPLRLDIARPLNRRKAVDGQVQVYFSIGQSF